MVVRALLIVAALAAHVDAKDTWSVVPPLGTTETTETVRPEVEAQIRAAMRPGTELDVRVWEGDDVRLVVMLLRFPAGDHNATHLRGYEDGFLRGLRKLNAEESFVTKTGRRTRDSLQTGTLQGQPSRLRLISGVGTDGRPRLLQAACIGAVAACRTAIDSIQLDESGFEDLDSVEREESSAYQVGQVIGYVTMLALVSWGISTAVRRRRRVRPLNPS